ncbi:hypothetical protein HWV00_08060 [Moritella sp. 24]|uniref:hypothetical protein n=1 Tax=Moritella sp. 24 TaxID=2746230 RepID=UPI001BA49666|nr:hypothetical protein [Moritella sp. 24]QUM76177.1 hypothetical protein HWV00_08060 [Moritella sp. 24]
MPENKKLYQTKLFKIAIGFPIVLAITVGLAIHFCTDAPQFLADIWGNYKIPMTIASLSMPLVAWVTANHRSEQTVKGLELQREKRLYEMYYEQQKHFEKVMGRRIKNAKFKYITEDDLPVIFSELYEFNRLQQKKTVSLKPEAAEQIKRFLSETNEIIYGFYDNFSKHKEQDPSQRRVLDGYIHQMYQFLQSNLHQLSDEIGVRYIDLSDASVEIFTRAYSEIPHLIYYMGDDFKDVWDDPIEEDGNTRNQNALYTFSAIESVIQTHMGIVGKANFSNLQHDISSREVIKMGAETPLQQIVTNFSRKLVDDLRVHLEFNDINLSEGKFEKYQFPTRDDCPTLELWFNETSDTEGHLVMTTPETEHKARLIIHDKKIEVDGEEKTKYTIDDDMGVTFIKNCFESTYIALHKV